MIWRQNLPSNGKITADTYMTVTQPAQILQVCGCQTGFRIKTDPEFSIVVGLLVI